MYRLTVIAGPNRGSSFPIQEGENSIGRQTGNIIVLPSARVSKKHCVVHLHGGDVMLSDSGSSNGTFVNGSLARNKRLKAGDRISVGEYVLELASGQSRFPAIQSPQRGLSSGAKVIAFPTTPSDPVGANSGPPKDLKGKLIWVVDEQVMPVFYGLMLKYEWKNVAGMALAVFLLLNLLISVFPMIEAGKQTVVSESRMRAGFMARQIVEKNTAAMAARAETKTEVGGIPREPGVRLAVLTDIEGRILAPASKLNSYLTSGYEANMAIQGKNQFRSGKETGFTAYLDPIVVAIEPVKVLNPAKGMNEVVGMAVVSIDTTLSTPDVGELGLTYGQTLILTGLLGGLIGLILYRMTLKPFQVLNDDMDKVLKGEMSQVTQEFKIPELDSLWDVINSAIQRVSRASGSESSGGSGSFGSSGSGGEDLSAPIRMMGQFSRFGIALLDDQRHVIYLNPVFEEVTGIRSDDALGRDLASVARDQAFASFSEDLVSRVSPGSEGFAEEFEFSGVGFRVHVAAFGNVGASPKAYLFCVVKGDS